MKKKKGLVQATATTWAQPTLKLRGNTKKPQADNAHLLPRVSGDTRCALCVTVLLFHWQLKHLENKNKDKIFLGVKLMFHRTHSFYSF